MTIIAMSAFELYSLVNGYPPKILLKAKHRKELSPSARDALAAILETSSFKQALDMFKLDPQYYPNVVMSKFEDALDEIVKVLPRVAIN